MRWRTNTACSRAISARWKNCWIRPHPAQAFAVRVLLLHNWQRIVLHDPQLPTPMEPDGWPGNAARALCRRIYWQVFDASERHLDAVAGRENARYRPAQADIMGRFGGRP